MSDLLEFAGGSRLSDGWGTLKEFEFLQDVPSTDLEFWWRADGITTANNGDAIQTLTNEAGTGNPTQATLASRAIYRTNSINGKPALDFDGVDDHYIVNGPQANFAGADLPITVYTVHKPNTTTVAITVLSMGRTLTSNTNWRFSHHSTGVYRSIKRDDAAVIATRDAGTTKTTPVLRVDSSSGFTYSLWENETAEVSGGAYNVGTLSLSRFVVGANFELNVLSQYFDGLIAEMLVYSVSHSTATRLQLSAYLKNKYRLYL